MSISGIMLGRLFAEPSPHVKVHQSLRNPRKFQWAVGRTETPIATGRLFSSCPIASLNGGRKRAFRCEVAHTWSPIEDDSGKTGAALLFRSRRRPGTLL